MKVILYPFIVLALLGLAASAGLHLADVLGWPPPPVDALWLYLGLFIVGLPATVVGNALAKNFKHNNYWAAVLRGCPPWMRLTTYGLFIYAVFNAAMFALALVSRKLVAHPPTLARVLSGLWMAFYSTGSATLYSATRATDAPHRRCPFGHPVLASDNFCPLCGWVLDL